MGSLNIEAALLPRWRGASPIQRLIESGDRQSGVTIMQMDIGLDTGDMLYKMTTEITPEDSAQSLHDRLSTIGSEAMMHTVTGLLANQIQPEQQDESLVTYAEKMTKDEALINWQEPAQKIVRKVQAFNPWPVAFTQFNEKPLRIWQARLATSEEINELNNHPAGTVIKLNKTGLFIATADRPICIEILQPPGKKAMSAYDFAQSRNLEGHQF